MAVTPDRRYSKQQVHILLEGAVGKTLGEIDSTRQFDRTIESPKITGIAGMVIEQSLFGYKKDSDQECDIEIDGELTELKTSGVRIPKTELKQLIKANKNTPEERRKHFGAKEGISVTGVTLSPTIQRDFLTSHFWQKSERILIVFYEYDKYDPVLAAEYANFKIVGYLNNRFTDSEIQALRKDWETVRDHLIPFYDNIKDVNERERQMEGFTHELRSKLMYVELVPAFKLEPRQMPRYRLKQTFVDTIVRAYFNKKRDSGFVNLAAPVTSFSDLDARCHSLTAKYRGTTFSEFKQIFGIEADLTDKSFGAKCVLKMFDAPCKMLNQINDFIKAGIIAKTVNITSKGTRTEDMKLKAIDFEEWASPDTEFVDSDLYAYFNEHSFLCPVFCERGNTTRKKMPTRELQEIEDKRVINEIGKTTFEGFKRFAFDDRFIMGEVQSTWLDSRKLIFDKTLKWEFEYDKNGQVIINKSGSMRGAPNFPKSENYIVFMRGGQNDSSDASRTECVNGIKMLPQFFWIKGEYIVNKLKTLNYL